MGVRDHYGFPGVDNSPGKLIVSAEALALGKRQWQVVMADALCFPQPHAEPRVPLTHLVVPHRDPDRPARAHQHP